MPYSWVGSLHPPPAGKSGDLFFWLLLLFGWLFLTRILGTLYTEGEELNKQ